MDPQRAQTGARILGITGPIGCGKTTVGNILLRLGAPERIDADAVVHDLMAAGTPTTSAIHEAFGDAVLRPDGSVDRARLGHIVFNDSEALRRLESIVHPAVRRRVRQRVAALHDQQGVIVVDAIKLLQSELLELVDTVWVVRCNQETEIARLMKNRGMSEEGARARIEASPSFVGDKVSRVIENDGDEHELEQQVTEAWYEQMRTWDL